MSNRWVIRDVLKSTVEAPPATKGPHGELISPEGLVITFQEAARDNRPGRSVTVHLWPCEIDTLGDQIHEQLIELRREVSETLARFGGE